MCSWARGWLLIATGACACLQLLSYRRGEYDLSSDLAQVDAPIRQLILHMIQLDPGEPPPGLTHAPFSKVSEAHTHHPLRRMHDSTAASVWQRQFVPCRMHRL